MGKATREKINNCLQLFQTLKELRLLSKENLASLQGMLWHLGRKDLCEKFITYCRNSDNKIHFVPASDQPSKPRKHFPYTLLFFKSQLGSSSNCCTNARTQSV